jgi:GNAT superfamily N-acetyltransferase
MRIDEVFGDQNVPTNQVRNEANTLVKGICSQADVDLITSFRDGNIYMEVSLIRLPKELRKQGIGSQIMKALCQFADQKSIIMALSPTSEFGTSKAALTKFYRSFGFVPNSGRSKNYQVMNTMIRYPKTTESIYETICSIGCHYSYTNGNR